MSHPLIAAALYDKAWCILPQKMMAIDAAFKQRSAGERISKEEIAAIVASSKPAERERPPSKVAVLPLFGTIFQHGGLLEESSGGTSTETFATHFRKAMADPDISSIVIEIDSPGGEVYGTPELAELIYKARGVKRVVGIANSMAASAAYWIGSAAEELYVTPSGEVGSIGVLCVHQDVSQWEEKIGLKTTLVAIPEEKIEGHPYAPLSDDVRAKIHDRISLTYDAFVAAVAKHRGVPPKTVREGVWRGGMATAKVAVAEKMADGVMTFHELLDREISGMRGKSRRVAAAMRVTEALK